MDGRQGPTGYHHANARRRYAAGMQICPSDECTICRSWPLALRPGVRDTIDRLRFTKPFCWECFLAAFVKWGWLEPRQNQSIH